MQLFKITGLAQALCLMSSTVKSGPCLLDDMFSLVFIPYSFLNTAFLS